MAERCFFDLQSMPRQLWQAFRLHCEAQGASPSKQLRWMVEAWLGGALPGMPFITEWLPIAEELIGTPITTAKRKWWTSKKFIQYSRVTTTAKLRDAMTLRAHLFGYRVWRVLNALVVWFLVSGAVVSRVVMLKVKIRKELAGDQFRAYYRGRASTRLEKKDRADIDPRGLAFPSVYKRDLREHTPKGQND